MLIYGANNIIQPELQSYELNRQEKISLSELVNIVIDTELSDVERIIIRKKYFEGVKCSVIGRQLNLSKVYEIHKRALHKIYTSLKYVIFYNVGSVGSFDEAFFKLVSDIAVKENDT